MPGDIEPQDAAEQPRRVLHAAPAPGPGTPPQPDDPARDPWAPPLATQPVGMSRGRTSLVVAAIAVVVAFALVVAASASYLVLRQQRAQLERQSAVQARVLAEMPALEAFVAAATGRPWRSAPHVTVLAEAEFRTALHGPGGSEPVAPGDDEDDFGVTVTAMGLAPSPDAFWDVTDAANDSHVTGFYDETDATLYVRGTEFTPQVEITVVHELVHANQDQSFGLASRVTRTRTDDESWLALQALIEGEATAIERDYAATKPESWRRSVEMADYAPPSDVPVSDTAGAFPYEIGAEFVLGLRRAGGTAAVTRAFSAPPLWTRDLADPARWVAGTLPAVHTPERPGSPTGSDDDVWDVGVLGVEGFWLAVDSLVPRSADLAELSGWAGDSYVATENGDADQWCLVDDVTFTDAAGKARAMAFLAPWVARAKVDVTDTGAVSVRLHVCHSS